MSKSKHLRCHNCGTPLRKTVHIIATAPAMCYDMTKSNIRTADIEITGVDWDRERFFCPKCGWHTAAKAAS